MAVCKRLPAGRGSDPGTVVAPKAVSEPPMGDQGSAGLCGEAGAAFGSGAPGRPGGFRLGEHRHVRRRQADRVQCEPRWGGQTAPGNGRVKSGWNGICGLFLPLVWSICCIAA